MARRKWHEPYRRTFRVKDTQTHAWAEFDLSFCPVNLTVRCVAIRAGGLPASHDLPSVYDRMRGMARTQAERWVIRLATKP